MAGDEPRPGPKAVVALLLCAGASVLATPRCPDRPERERLAARFAFKASEIDACPELPRVLRRPVHPDYEHIAGWISTVGAALALHDLDHDGLSNDLCLVDPRTNRVVVRPVPGTGDRYPEFTLDAPAPDGVEPATTAPMGCVPADLNEDGRADVVVYYWGRTPVVFLGRERPEPGRALVLSERDFVGRALLDAEERWFTNALTTADVDGDGHLDLVVGNYFPDGARVLDAGSSEPQAMHDSMSRAYNGGQNRILLWRAAGPAPDPWVRFEEAPGALAGERGPAWTLALGAADLDGDALPEIYEANDFGPDRLLHNRSRPGHVELVPVSGRRGLTTPRSKVLGGDSFKGMGVDFADLNGDGDLDIHVGNITTEFGLQESNLLFLSTGDRGAFRRGIAPYVERSEELGLARTGWTWDTRFGDFDNDGTSEVLHATGFLRGQADRWPELHEAAMGNDELLHCPAAWHRFAEGDDLSGNDPDTFFARAADGRWVNLAHELGLDAPRVSRALATADVDADGRLDWAVGCQWQPSQFFHNLAPRPGAFLGLFVRFPVGESGDAPRVVAGPPPPGHCSRPAVGALARVRLADGRRLVALVDGGNGHAGVRAPELHFGLGTPPPAEVEVELEWRAPSGRPQRGSWRLAPGWYTLWLGGGEAR